MRLAAKLDDNQNEIVKGLRKIPGVTVQSTAACHGGVPDIMVGYRGRNYWFEIKDGRKVPSKQALTPDQEKWHGKWTGHVAIVTSLDQALAHLGFM